MNIFCLAVWCECSEEYVSRRRRRVRVLQHRPRATLSPSLPLLPLPPLRRLRGLRLLVPLHREQTDDAEDGHVDDARERGNLRRRSIRAIVGVELKGVRWS